MWTGSWKTHFRKIQLLRSSNKFNNFFMLRKFHSMKGWITNAIRISSTQLKTQRRIEGWSLSMSKIFPVHFLITVLKKFTAAALLKSSNVRKQETGKELTVRLIRIWLKYKLKKLSKKTRQSSNQTFCLLVILKNPSLKLIASHQWTTALPIILATKGDLK